MVKIILILLIFLTGCEEKPATPLSRTTLCDNGVEYFYVAGNYRKPPVIIVKYDRNGSIKQCNYSGFKNKLDKKED